MGIIYSWLGYGIQTGRSDDPDAVSGLTSRDKYMIRNSWATVMKDTTGNGVKFFMRLFEIQPKYLQSFPFKDIPMVDLPNNKKFQAHCNAIMYSFGSLVGVLDDYEIFQGIAEKLGRSHAYRGVDKNALNDVKNAAIDTFSFMSKAELVSWGKLLDLLMDEMNIAIESTKKTKNL